MALDGPMIWQAEPLRRGADPAGSYDCCCCPCTCYEYNYALLDTTESEITTVINALIAATWRRCWDLHRIGVCRLIDTGDIGSGPTQHVLTHAIVTFWLKCCTVPDYTPDGSGMDAYVKCDDRYPPLDAQDLAATLTEVDDEDDKGTIQCNTLDVREAVIDTDECSNAQPPLVGEYSASVYTREVLCPNPTDTCPDEP